MKKIYLFKTLLLLCALMAGSGSAWAEDSETLTMNNKTSVSGDNVILEFGQGSNTSNGPALNNNKTRLYPGNTITITSNGGKYSLICLNNCSGISPIFCKANTELYIKFSS